MVCGLSGVVFFYLKVMCDIFYAVITTCPIIALSSALLSLMVNCDCKTILNKKVLKFVTLSNFDTLQAIGADRLGKP